MNEDTYVFNDNEIIDVIKKVDRLKKVYAMLSIVGDDIDPEEISARLSLTPTRSFKKGDIFTPGGGLHNRTYGTWILSTKNSVESEELLEHSECLLRWLQPVKEQLKKILLVDGVRISVAFWWAPNDGPVGFSFPSSEITALAELCSDFDFYFA